jgi:hypothetical protein
MPRGHDQILYILFDHRSSFRAKLFGWKSSPSKAQTAQISIAKQVIYDGAKSALVAGVPKDKADTLVDEQFGILPRRGSQPCRHRLARGGERGSRVRQTVRSSRCDARYVR